MPFPSDFSSANFFSTFLTLFFLREFDHPFCSELSLLHWTCCVRQPKERALLIASRALPQAQRVPWRVAFKTRFYLVSNGHLASVKSKYSHINAGPWVLTISGLIIMEILTDPWVKCQVVPKNRAPGQRTEKSQLRVMLQIKRLLHKTCLPMQLLGRSNIWATKPAPVKHGTCHQLGSDSCQSLGVSKPRVGINYALLTSYPGCWGLFI